MLKRKLRLPAQTKMSNPRFFKTAIFTLKIAKNNLEHSRFGFIISKKVAKTAVDRNRSKRLLRSCIEDQIEAMEKGFDFLFIINKNLADQKREDLCREATSILLSLRGVHPTKQSHINGIH